jgi:aspartyl-tRNA(Asn)/glutamyl-tRNA(Gln) amidotransferase subunit B
MSTARWEPVIGLEVHCQLATASKMFSACPMAGDDEANTRTDPYTLGLPGTLPVPNARAVRSAVALGLALGCEIRATSRFARKHYFYPDLPKGYQITQSDEPYARGGAIDLPESGRRVRLVRIHMEEDAGKNVHVAGDDVSLVDYNRAGAPLVEIVTEPDLRAPEEAAELLRQLRAIVRALGISSADMEAGELRCDANVSLRPPGATELGTRCEIKNLNSFRFLAQAISAEIRRQADLLDAGKAVQMATLSYDPARDRTRIMRTKEEAADYRYMPDPDLPPLSIPGAWIEEIRAEMPELPMARRARWLSAGVGEHDARLFSTELELGDWFDRVVAAGAVPKKAASWVSGELLAKLGDDARSIADSPVTPEGLAELLALVDDGTLSLRAAKAVFFTAWDEGVAPAVIVERDGHRQVSDTALLEAAVREVLAASAAQVEQYRAGKTAVRGYFVGQVMKKTRGQANPQVVGELLDRLLPPVDDEG